MTRVFKRVGFTLLALVAILIVFITISYANHKVNLSKEDKLFVPIGQSVEVNGHDMHLYIEGEGQPTIVFMSGGGTSSPVLDFKSLYSLLSDEYRIAVVEKIGYGFSEVADVERDIDTILFETREALIKSGINGPYILMSHSMSGIEALYWAQIYPDEVVAIIGLDMSVPKSYEDYKINLPMIKLAGLAANIGITRWMPDLAESDAIKYGALSDEEKELYRVIFYRRTATKTMLNEVRDIKENASKVNDGGVPNVPILIFSSNGEGTGWDEDAWKSHQQSYVEDVEHGEVIDLNCSHYVHNFEYEYIANKTKEFIRSLN